METSQVPHVQHSYDLSHVSRARSSPTPLVGACRGQRRSPSRCRPAAAAAEEEEEARVRLRSSRSSGPFFFFSYSSSSSAPRSSLCSLLLSPLLSCRLGDGYEMKSEGGALPSGERAGVRWAEPRPRGTTGGGTFCTSVTSGRRQSWRRQSVKKIERL